MLLEKFFYDFLRVRQFPVKKTKDILVRNLINELKPLPTDKSLIRMGGNADGGYLLPDDLTGISACFSPGVADCSDFEADCAKLGMEVFLADFSLKKLPRQNPKFHFLKKFIGANTNESFIRLDDWVDSSDIQTSSDLMLQMDIEGFEYETLISLSDKLLKRFRIMIVEFHGLHNLWNFPFFKLAKSAFDRVLQYHSCVHIHPNNSRGICGINGLEIPKLMEFTFYRKDCILKKSNDRILNFPHPLDHDNTGNRHIALPSCWYSK